MARPPVASWTSDFDVLDPEYVADPFGIWADLRRQCPIAHTDRRVSTWLPTRYADAPKLLNAAVPTVVAAVVRLVLPIDNEYSLSSVPPTVSVLPPRPDSSTYTVLALVKLVVVENTASDRLIKSVLVVALVIFRLA